MKKRLIALCLALAFVLAALPGNLVSLAADSLGDLKIGSSADNAPGTTPSVVGKTVKFKSTYPWLWIDQYNAYNKVVANASKLPALLKIVAVHQFSASTTLYQLEAADGYTWPAGYPKEDFTGKYWIESTNVEFVEPKNTVVDADGKAVSSVQMGLYEKPVLTAKSPFSAQTADVKYQWQIEYAAGKWVNIHGATGKTVTLSLGMVATLLDAEGKVNVRVKGVAGSQEAYSDAIAVQVIKSAAAASAYNMANPSVADNGVMAAAEGDGPVTYDVIIKYMSKDGSEVVAEPYGSTVSPTTILSNTISFPKVLGYVPMVEKNGTWVRQDTYTFDGTPFTSDFTLEVRYFPDAVNYKVNIYIQNAENDEYVLLNSFVEQERTGTVIDAIDFPIAGYYQSKFTSDDAAIAADGSTEFDLYYDRVYYLMKFDLDGGYGVQPIYARHGVKLDIPNPTKAGHSFVGWDQTEGTPVVGSEILNDGIANTMYTNMPIGDTAYKAIWEAAENAKVTIVYWGENPNDEGYSYKESVEIYAAVGETLTFKGNNGSQLICTLTAHAHGNGCTYGCGKDIHTHSEANNCYSDKVICQIESHNHAQAGCTLNCSHKEHDLNCYNVPNGRLVETNKPSENLTNVGNGVYTYTSWVVVVGTLTHYYLNIGDKWYTSNAEWYEGGDTNVITLSCTHGHTNLCWSCRQNETSHVHTVVQGCYELSCTTPEHTHNADCYSCIAHAHSNSCYLKTPAGDAYDSKLWTYVKSDTVTVAADGSTVMNVYYDRTTFTLTFKGSSNYGGTNKTYGTISDKWGADIETEFFDICKSAYETAGTYSWSEKTNAGSPWTSYVGVMPQRNITYYAYDANGTMTAYYYFQTFDGKYNDENGNVLIVKAEGSGFTVTDEDRAEFEGFTHDKSISTDNGSYFNGAKFYYTRNNYTLEFNNGEDIVNTVSVPYEANLGGYDFTPKAPSKYEPGSVQFDGWYQNPECTGAEVVLSATTMPSSNMILYAKWVPVNHNVTIYRYKNVDGSFPTGNDVLNATFTVKHGELVQSSLGTIPEDPKNGNYRFIGWFYMDGGKEKAFDFKNMPVMQDLQIYARWSSNVQIPYTIKYVIKGTETEIAEPVSGKHYAGETHTFKAKTGTQLSNGYQTGYFPTVPSHSITFNEKDESYVYTFEYIQKDKLPYSVYYVTETQNASGDLVPIVLVEDGKTKTYYIVAETKTVETANAIVTENFVAVSGYMPDAYQKTLIMNGADDAVNQIIFKYTVDTKHAYYKVNHWTQQINGSWYLHATYENVGTIGDSYTEGPMSIDGFTYSGTVYKVKEVVLDQEDITENGVVLTADGLEINLYYNRNKYAYTVEYRLQGTDVVLHTVPNLEKQFYGDTVSHEAPLFWGDGDVYERVSAEKLSTPIQIDESKNVIIFYYQEREVKIQYIVAAPGGGAVNPSQETVLISSGNPEGAQAEALPGYKFIGWFTADNVQVGTTETFVPEKVNGLNVAATYYAKFEEIKVEIKYEVVGPTPGCGTVTPGSEIVGVVTGNPSSTAAASSNVYKFVGWYDNAECTGDPLSTDATYNPAKVDGLHVAATYYAKFEYNLTSLTIKKTGWQSIDPNQTFIFNVSGNGVDLDVTVHGNGSVTIDGLTVGAQYTITEKTDWSWRYNCTGWTHGSASGEGNVANITLGLNGTITFNNTRPVDKWLDGDSWCDNLFN